MKFSDDLFVTLQMPHNLCHQLDIFKVLGMRLIRILVKTEVRTRMNCNYLTHDY